MVVCAGMANKAAKLFSMRMSLITHHSMQKKVTVYYHVIPCAQLVRSVGRIGTLNLCLITVSFTAYEVTPTLFACVHA